MPPKKRQKHRKRHLHDSGDLQGEIEALFNKKFVLKSSEETWTLPDSSSMFQELPFILEDMISLKNELNRKKSLLNDMDIVQWHLHTRRAHKAGLVVKHLRENIHAEMCTQAWTKFHEILNSYDLIPGIARETEKLRSVHLCEAPGAFIASLNHFVKSYHHSLEWDWVANTLNPYYEGHDLTAMLDDDRFVLQTLSHWHFGVDGTGDLMKLANLESLQQDTCTTDIHLVTADGSINCANQPDEQESLVGQLIFCEAVAAVNLLCQGGNFVFKMFTAFEHLMISLLYLLACLFQEVQVIKPGTSKSGNSEIYVVCLTFIGKEEIPSSVMEKLCEGYDEHCPSSSLFSLSSIPSMFLERLRACEEYFTSLQMEAIDQNIQQFHHMSSRKWKAHAQLRELVVENFVERFHLKPINKEEHVIPGAHLDGTQLSFTRGPTNDVPFRESFNGRHQMGSYNERNENLNQNWLEKTLADGQFQFRPTQLRSLQDYSQVYNEVPLIPLCSDQVVWLEGVECVTPEVMAATWKPQSAARLNAVLNSRFCTPFYISKLQDAHQQAAILREENVDNLISINDKVCPSNIVKMSKGGEAEVRNLDNLVSFTEMVKCDNFGIVLNLSDSLHYLGQYLQEKHTRFSSIRLCISAERGTLLATINQETAFQFRDISQHVKRVSQIGDEEKINLVFADLNHSNELSAKRDLLSICITALKLLGDHGMFVCHVCETLTRFSVGLLYIFHHIFDKLTIVKPVMSQLSSPQRFLVCKGFHCDNNHYVAYLEEVLHQLTMLANDESAFDVMEIVPMQLLYSEQFYAFVKKKNEQLAHVQLQNIVQLENYFLYPDKMPSAEDISNLREDIASYLK